MTDVSTVDLSFLDERVLNEWIVAQRWFASKTREVSSIAIIDSVPLRTDAAAARADAGRGALPHRHARDLPGAARPAPGRRGLDRAGDLRGRRLDGLRRARRPRRGPRAAARDALQRATQDEFRFRWAAGRRAVGGTVDVRPVGVEQSNTSIVFGDDADPEGVPQGRAGRQPGARAAALPDRPRLPAHRLAGRLVRGRRAATSARRSGSCRSSWPAPATAGTSRWTS